MQRREASREDEGRGAHHGNGTKHRERMKGGRAPWQRRVMERGEEEAGGAGGGPGTEQSRRQFNNLFQCSVGGPWGGTLLVTELWGVV